MKNYLLCARNLLIDPETFQFVTNSRKKNPCHIDVPWFLWEHGDETERQAVTGFEFKDGVPVNVYSSTRKTTEVNLNRLTVGFNQAFRSMHLKFFDVVQNADVELDVGVSPETSVVTNSRNKSYPIVVGAHYALKVGEHEVYHHQVFKGQKYLEEKFQHITSLAKSNGDFPGRGHFSYGVVPHQYTVSYRGKPLGGKTLAFICGIWAILLNDDLTFDALVCLRAAKNYTLDIERIFYTTNTYLVKVSSLM